jgi:hypothetical protein
MLTPTGAMGLAGAAAAQPNADAGTPPPPPAAFPPIPVITILLADLVLGIYIATRHSHARIFLPVPNSAT